MEENIAQGLKTLLDLHGMLIEQEKGCWIKFDVTVGKETIERPHGLRYSLTLHNEYGIRLMGFDNAHLVKPPKKFKYSGRIIPYDHVHRHASDKGTPYEFKDAYQLLTDFFKRVDQILNQL